MRKSIAILLLACAALWLVAMPALAQDIDPIATLKSDAPAADKMEACRILSRQGTKDAIPVLASLLTDEKLAHMARYALEPMPYPEAGQALRDALGKTSGLLKVGVISSLAARDDEQVVPDLIALLPDSDMQVQQSAAKALGDIATPAAADALTKALDQPNLSANSVHVVCDALLACAESFLADGQADRAAPIYSRLMQFDNAPSHVHTAALRGSALVRIGDARARVVTDALYSDDEATFGMALRIGRELNGVTPALAEALASLPDARKVKVLAVFEPGDAGAAGAAALAQAKEGPVDVRVAAIKAVTRMGYDPALELIEQLASADDESLAKAARDSISYFPGNKGNAAIRAMLHAEQPETRRVAVEMVGQGALENPVAPLMDAALRDADAGVRLAALDALHTCAGVDQMPQLLDSYLKASSPEESQATRTVLAAISEREKQMPGGIVVEKAVYGDLPDGPSADVLGKVREMVESGAFAIQASNANFGDPASGRVKKLRIDYTDHGTPVSMTVPENETVKLAVATAPPVVVDAFCDALNKAQGDAKLGMIRLLGSTGSQKAFDAVEKAAGSADAAVKEEALRTMCDWPTSVALPALKKMAADSDDAALKLAALRGVVRLMGQSNTGAPELVADYAELLDQASSPDATMAVLGGLSQVPSTDALLLAFGQFGDKAVHDEAVQSAINIARSLGKSAKEDTSFFNGKDLSGWNGDKTYWKAVDGAVVGHSDTEVPKNEFIWSDVDVGDFYLVLDVRLEPNSGNAGIQFRSKQVDDEGKAQGYQADVGEGYWGRLYHEDGRGMLDDTDAAEKAVKLGEWNRYEILAVGPAIWTAINGTLGVAYLDQDPSAEPSGKIAFQIHSGPPLTAGYRVIKLVHDPKIELEGMKLEDLMMKLKVSKK